MHSLRILKKQLIVGVIVVLFGLACSFEIWNFARYFVDYGEVKRTVEPDPFGRGAIATSNNQQRCFYEVLNVSKTASLQEIKKQFRRLSMKYHPDRNKAKDAADKFKEIVAAYEVLSNSDKRKIYDAHGHEGLDRFDGGGMETHDPFDLFDNFFNIRQRSGGKEKVAPTAINLRVTLEDLFFGKKFEVQFTRPVLCEHINDCIIKRKDCHGPGLRVITQQMGPGFLVQNQISDESCVDNGQAWDKNCKLCQNGLTELKDVNLEVYIEPGMKNGELISFKSVGEAKIGYETGDLNFSVDTVPHIRYERDGNNLKMKMDIDLLEALVGFKREITHIDKKKIVIERQSVVHENDLLIIRGKGMPILEDLATEYINNSGINFGDLYVYFRVNFPLQVPANKKELLSAALKDLQTRRSKTAT